MLGIIEIASGLRCIRDSSAILSIKISINAIGINETTGDSLFTSMILRRSR